MAELTNKLHIKKDGVVHECTCYTTVEEATPTTIPGGSAWEIKNNGVICYVGLWPISEVGGNYHTPLTIKKNCEEYYVDTQVVNMVTVTIVQSANQIIKVACNGEVYTETFEVLAGSQISVTVEPDIGYTAGSPSISNSYVNTDLIITTSPASKATYLITIEQTSYQIITVTCNDVQYTSNFTAEYGDTWTATVVAVDGYTAGSLSAVSGTVTGSITISATAAEEFMYTIQMPQGEGQYSVNGVNGNIFAVKPNTSVTVSTVNSEQWEAQDLYAVEGELIEITIKFIAGGNDYNDTSNATMSANFICSELGIEKSGINAIDFTTDENSNAQIKIWAVIGLEFTISFGWGYWYGTYTGNFTGEITDIGTIEMQYSD